MKGLLLFFSLLLCAFCEPIVFSQKLKTLQITLPQKEKYTTLTQTNSLIITLSSPLKQEAKTHTLLTPFEKIQFLSTPSNQAQIIIWGENLTLTQKGDNLLEIHSEILKISWWNYFYVCLFLTMAIIVLAYLKKRKPTKPTKYSEIFLSPKSKIITFEYNQKEYIIFSNERGNLLLNHYPKTPHNKDFTQLINEE